MIEALQKLMEDGNLDTKQRAFQLYNSCITPSFFVVCLFVMAEYSAMLEPVANTLQGIAQNLLYKKHRETADIIFSTLWKKIENCSAVSNIELRSPRLTQKQTHRSNVPSDSPESYYRRAVFIPYLDSLITSIGERFPEENEASYFVCQLSPKYMKNWIKNSMKT